MADRFPLIVDSTTQTIKELPSGDNLDLTGSSIVNASSIDVTGTIKSASATQSTLYLSNAAKTTGFLVGRSLASNDAQDFFIYDVTAASTRLAIDSSGNVGIGTSPSAQLHSTVGSAGSGTLAQAMFGYLGGSTHYLDANTIIFRNGSASESMRIDNSGNLLVGRTGHSGYGVANFEGGADFTGGDVLLCRDTGNVGIGTSSPSTYAKFAIRGGLTVNAGSTSLTGASFSTSDAANSTFWITHASGTTNLITDAPMAFYTASGSGVAERMRIDSSGRVGIGVTPSTLWSSSYDALQIGLGGSMYAHESAASNVGIAANSVYEGVAPNFYDKYLTSSTATKYVQDSGLHIWSTAASGTAGDAITWSEAMRIDSSGNLLVGTTSAFGTTGTTINSAGLVYSSADGDRAGQFDRTGISDGEIVRFTRTGTTVGSIGSRGGVVSHIILDPRSGGAGLTAAGASLFPTDNVGTVSDAAIDLGYSVSGTNYRFKDLYLSGTSNVGVGRFTAQNSTNSAATLVLGHEGASKSQIRAYGINAGTIGSLEFMVSAADGTGSNSMTLDASGNLLVGDTSTVPFDGTSGVLIGGARTSLAFATTGHTHKMLYSVNTGTAGLHFYDSTNNRTDMIWDNSGNLLVGTTNSSASVDEGIKLRSGFADKGVGLVSTQSTNAAEGFTMWSTGANAWRFYVGWDGKINATSNTIQAISDQRFKENIRDLDDGLSKVMELRPRKFDWKEGKGADIKDARGFIAQEFEEVFPDLVGEWKDKAPEGEEPYKAVSQDLIPTLVKAIQEQQAIIEALTARIEAIES